MLITASGEAFGTVGGGCVDGMVYAEIEDVLRTERPKTVIADLTENDDPEHGLICIAGSFFLAAEIRRLIRR